MKHGRRKQVKRVLTFYNTHFKFHKPYRVLCDGPFLHAVCCAKLDLHVCLENLFGEPCSAFTTDAVVYELEKLGAVFADAVALARRLPKMRDYSIPEDHVSALERLLPDIEAYRRKAEQLLGPGEEIDPEVIEKHEKWYMKEHLHICTEERHNMTHRSTSISGTSSIFSLLTRGNPSIGSHIWSVIQRCFNKDKPLKHQMADVETKWSMQWNFLVRQRFAAHASLLLPNVDRFFVASQVPSLQTLAHSLPGIPLLYVDRGVVHMESSAGWCSTKFVEMVETRKMEVKIDFRMSEDALPAHRKPAVVGVHAPGSRKRFLPNPLSCKRGERTAKRPRTDNTPSVIRGSLQDASSKVESPVDVITKTASDAAETPVAEGSKRRRKRSHSSRSKPKPAGAIDVTENP